MKKQPKKCVCGGLMCMPHDIKYKCIKCKRDMCGISRFTVNDRDFCVNCWFTLFLDGFNNNDKKHKGYVIYDDSEILSTYERKIENDSPI